MSDKVLGWSAARNDKRDGGAYRSDYDDEIRQARECLRCSADFMQRITQAERECDSLKQQLLETNAACAEMRETLENIIIRSPASYKSLKQQLAEAERERDSLKQQLLEANNIIRNLVDNALGFGGQCYECKAFDPGDCFKCYMGEAHEYVRTCLKRGENDA